MKKLLVVLLITLHSSLITLCEAQYTVLLNFDTVNGIFPQGSLTLEGNMLYGMVAYGGANGNGCIFRMNTNGTGFNDMHDFADSASGTNPFGTLLLSGNKLFGMTRFGGRIHDSGSIFSMDTNGTNYNQLLDFNDTNGAFPFGSLIISGKRLYGMTNAGGAHNKGVIFSVDTNGTGYKDLHDFVDSTGVSPFGSLAMAGNKLFGLTDSGGAQNGGCVFSIDTNGAAYTVLFDLTPSVGVNPLGDLLISNGVMYGTTWKGGVYSEGTVFSVDTNGLNYTQLQNFNGATGGYPHGSLILAGDTLYGLAGAGGFYGKGCVYSVLDNGTTYTDRADFSTLYGAYPLGSLVHSEGYLFYGMAQYGGSNNVGVVFSFNDTATGAGINQVKGESEKVKVYPNPSTGIFTIASVGAKHFSPAAIEVFNVLGEKVYSSLISQHSSLIVDLRSKSNGVYFYRVLSEIGGLIGEGKIIIQK